MTRILITPLLQQAVGTTPADAVLTARPSYTHRGAGAQVLVPQTLRFEFDADGTTPVVELEAPTGWYWRLHLQIGSWHQRRDVIFTGPEVAWDALTDVIAYTGTTLPPGPDGVLLTEAGAVLTTETGDLLAA